jgi:hypothetical protein
MGKRRHEQYRRLFSRRYGVARSDLKGCPENAGQLSVQLAAPGCCLVAVASGCHDQRKGGMDLGDGSPDGGGFLSVSLPEVLLGFRREFVGLAVVSWAIHRYSSCCLVVQYWSNSALVGL